MLLLIDTRASNPLISSISLRPLFYFPTQGSALLSSQKMWSPGHRHCSLPVSQTPASTCCVVTPSISSHWWWNIVFLKWSQNHSRPPGAVAAPEWMLLCNTTKQFVRSCVGGGVARGGFTATVLLKLIETCFRTVSPWISPHAKSDNLKLHAQLSHFDVCTASQCKSPVYKTVTVLNGTVYW